MCFWRAWITWARLASRFADDQQALIYAIWHIYGVVLVVLVILSCTRDEHLLWEGRVWRGHVALHVIYAKEDKYRSSCHLYT